jgi:acyl-CoA thioesterase-1
VGDWPAPGDRHPLLLTAGQLGRTVIEPLRQAKLAQQLLRTRARRCRVRAMNDLRQENIFQRIEVRKQVMNW